MVNVSCVFIDIFQNVMYICYLPGGRSVWEKNVPEVLSTALGKERCIKEHIISELLFVSSSYSTS